MLSLSLAQAWPKSAQVRPRPGPGLGLGIWKSGKLEIPKFGIQNIPKIEIIKIKIRVAQNVGIGKVWISRNKSSQPHLRPFQPFFSTEPINAIVAIVLFFFLGGPMGPIHLVWGHVLVSLG